MENDIISLKSSIPNEFKSINCWFQKTDDSFDKVSVAYGNIHKARHIAQSVAIVNDSLEDQLVEEISWDNNSEQVSPDLAAIRIELSLQKLSGKHLDEVEKSMLDELNAMMVKHVNNKRSSSELDELRTMSFELKDILSLLKK